MILSCLHSKKTVIQNREANIVCTSYSLEDKGYIFFASLQIVSYKKKRAALETTVCDTD